LFFLFVTHVIYFLYVYLSLSNYFRLLIAVIFLLANYDIFKFILLVVYLYISKDNFSP
jgi:hypothetical protein